MQHRIIFPLNCLSTLVTEKPNVLINQFPCESVLTVKDLLAACVHLAFRDKPMNEDTLKFEPPWFCTTFNLKTELPQFVSYFQRREEMDFDNTWIIKPWNLARSLDTFVTNNLTQIIRLIDSGPKVACKYIDDPVLFHRPDVDAW
uniref:Uncharacterized protein n=1 Tax=Romanomermis culicivorax TaxID=13658 RepID=A0A915KLW4_ROMCU